MNKPAITKTTHLLPFQELSPAQFERLCLWLVERKGYLRPEHLGEAGSEQGRDVIAYKADIEGEQLWYFQCKRYKSIGATTLIKEVEKYNRLATAAPAKRPFGIVFVTNAVLSADSREKVESRCRIYGYACEFWTGTELDMLVKKFDDIVAEFFNTGDRTPITVVQPLPQISALNQTPDPSRNFTGRDEELQDLLANLNNGTTIFGIHGMGGVGKTSLAYRLVAEIKERFDAHLYVDLRGTDQQPISATQAMTYVVQAFDQGFKPPNDESQVAGIYQSVLRQRRVLLLFDDARDRQQVERLVPPAGCLMIVTSRQHFRLPGMHNRDLNVLPDEDARQMLLSLAPRIGEQAQELALLCGNLPIALQLAASALNEHHRNLTPAEYTQRLRERREQRLELVEATIEISYELLDQPLRKLWRELSVWQSFFDVEAAAAIWGMRYYKSVSIIRRLFTAEHNLPFNIGEAQDTLGELVKFSLVELDIRTGLYRLHELARVFADAKLGKAERRSATKRSKKHSSKVLSDFQTRVRVIVTEAITDMKMKQLHSIRELAKSWVRDIAYADLERGAYYVETGETIKSIETLFRALTSFRAIEDRKGECDALNNLGLAYMDLGKPRKALKMYEQSLSVSRGIGDRENEGYILGNLGFAFSKYGKPYKAIESYERALMIFREIGDLRRESSTLFNLSLVLDQVGEHKRANKCAEASIKIKENIHKNNRRRPR
jgi:tetratricopeptide (TPR) repeat protein